ncbi:MAG: hypothetical protein V1686_02880 [Patescibacteria group bacterium]
MKKVLPLIIIGVIVIGLVFFVGFKIGGKKSTTFGKNGPGTFTAGDIVNGGMRSRNSGANFVNGEIISKDDTSITVKSRDGGSKIIFYSDVTEISKFISGVASDLGVGKTIMITGTTNSDGSITAKTIQLRPETLGQPVPQQ